MTVNVKGIVAQPPSLGTHKRVKPLLLGKCLVLIFMMATCLSYPIGPVIRQPDVD